MYKAGLLAPGSSYCLRLPIPIHGDSGLPAGFVTGYSGGTAPELHGIPY